MLGTSLLFWGAMAGRPMTGVMLALVVEARHWTRFRWEFDDETCGRAWQFTSVAIALSTVLIWLDGNRYTALPSLLSWLPPLLLPMQFVQSYGLRDSMSLNIFSFLARHRRERNRRLGLSEETTEFNFGNVYFAVILVAATVGYKADTWMFLPGTVVLTGWMFLAGGRCRPLALIPVLAVAGLLGLAGQIGLEKAEEWIGLATSAYRGRFDPNFVITQIGSRGPIEQSSDIVWRLRPKTRTLPPKLLRTATFNTYLGTNWQNQRVAVTNFKDLDTQLFGERAVYLLQPAEKAGKILDLPCFTLRGAATAESPLPLPGDVAGLMDFELDGIERNEFGTVRVYPKQAVIDGTVFWNGGTNPEEPPVWSEDLRIPIAERDKGIGGEKEDGAVCRAVQNLHLEEQPDLQAKLSVMRAWFHQNFRYTRNPTIQLISKNRSGNYINQATAVTRFLTNERIGHCEYFATAATLMLRYARIPARYATGYAVIERDMKRGEYIMRGTHSHAWCRVWDAGAGTWIDFDPTPPDWFAAVSQEPTAMQRFNDGLKRLREDFFIWRNRPANRLAVSSGMMGLGLALAAFVMKRLWRSKRRLEARSQAGTYDGPAIRTPLHELESRARKLIGRRPPGQPFGEWLARLRPNLKDIHLLDEAIALHQQLRFDPAPTAAGRRERLARLTRQLESALKNG